MPIAARAFGTAFEAGPQAAQEHESDMAKILVTGGWFIGSHIVDACIEAGHVVCIVDDFSSGVHENVNARDGLRHGHPLRRAGERV